MGEYAALGLRMRVHASAWTSAGACACVGGCAWARYTRCVRVCAREWETALYYTILEGGRASERERERERERKREKESGRERARERESEREEERERERERERAR